MERFTGLLGLIAIVASAYVFSTNRRAIQPRVIFWGLGLQFGFAFLVLKTNFGYVFKAAADGVLEEPHRGLYVREVIGEPPEDGYVPRDRSIQRGQPPGHDPLVRHGVESVDHKPVRVAQLQRRGDRLRGGAMPCTGVGEEKEQALGGGHGRGAS